MRASTRATIYVVELTGRADCGHRTTTVRLRTERSEVWSVCENCYAEGKDYRWDGEGEPYRLKREELR